MKNYVKICIPSKLHSKLPPSHGSFLFYLFIYLFIFSEEARKKFPEIEELFVPNSHDTASSQQVTMEPSCNATVVVSILDISNPRNGSANPGPRATSSPRKIFVWPTNFIKLRSIGITRPLNEVLSLSLS